MKGLPAPHSGTLIFIDNNFFPRHLPSHLPQETAACLLRDDSSWDAFPATPPAERGHLALPFPMQPYACRKQSDLSLRPFSPKRA